MNHRDSPTEMPGLNYFTERKVHFRLLPCFSSIGLCHALANCHFVGTGTSSQALILDGDSLLKQSQRSPLEKVAQGMVLPSANFLLQIPGGNNCPETLRQFNMLAQSAAG